MNRVGVITGLIIGSLTVPASAGPPYLTDDPIPTDQGHWEVYVFTSGEHSNSDDGGELDGEGGLDLNYGAIKGVQLTATVPVSFSHEALNGWRSGPGDLELGVKYRFLDDQKEHFSAAIFPRAILPTSTIGGQKRVRLLLPLWIERDFPGSTSVFGGGGYEINPGPGNRDDWQTAMAVTHDLDKNLSLGAEIAWQQSDTVGGGNQTRAAVGSIVKLSDHYALLISTGPTWMEHHTGYHFYAALGLDF